MDVAFLTHRRPCYKTSAMSFTNLPATATLDELTPKQRAFVGAFLALDGRAGAETDAALAAGLGNGVRDKAARAAREMMRNPRVLSATRTELSNRFTSAAALAVATLIDLCRNGPPSVRLSAAQEVLSRSLGPIASRSSVQVTVDNSAEALLAAYEAEKRGEIVVFADAVGPERVEIAPPDQATKPVK